MGGLIGKLISLDFSFLVGLRTKLGIFGFLAGQLLDTFASDAWCVQFPKLCAVAKTVSMWLIAAGIYGKKE